MLQPSEIERALVITAHPDDVDFGAAGTVGVLTDSGVEVTYCLVTDGDAGGFDLSIARPAMAAMRREEQTRAAKEVGVAELCFLGHPDGRVEASLELRQELSRVIRQVRPQVVVTQSPERNLERIFASHPDHLATGEAALCAVYPDARNPFAHASLLGDEGLDAWTVEEVWVMAGPQPNHAVDITDTFPKKIAALRAHESQTAHMDDLESFVRGWGEMTAERFELPAGRLAEAFQIVRTG